MMYFYDDNEVQKLLTQYLHTQRKKKHFSRDELAKRSGVPASTIRKFENTGQISLRQFLALWLVLDDMEKLVALSKEIPTMPKTIEEVLSNE
ncbi:MAG: helix-turn-helix transcriptional regulator [Cardiobacteriaceae bacterium]|nr:helix-turn-helix transcriptional regulator [Cardiobacteriaceae bacterium]